MAAPAPKPEEISHPPMDQLQGLEYCIDSNPSWGMADFIPFLNSPPSPFIDLFIHFLTLLVFACENRGGNFSGIPALHFGLRNCSYDPIIPCSFDGWRCCEPIRYSFIYVLDYFPLSLIVISHNYFL